MSEHDIRKEIKKLDNELEYSFGAAALKIKDQLIVLWQQLLDVRKAKAKTEEISVAAD